MNMRAVINLNATRPVLPSFPPCGLSISESRHAAGFQMPLSRYDFSEVMLIMAGEGWVIHRDVRQKVTKENLIVVPRGTSYRFEDNKRSPLSILCLCLKPAESLSLLFQEILPRKFTVIKNHSICAQATSDLRIILHEQSLPGSLSEPVVVAHSILLLTRLRRQTEPLESPPAGLELSARVRDYVAGMERTFFHPETLEMVASRLKMSPRTLSRHFRAITGKSRRRYVQELRLRHARRLLKETEQPITTIAFACGFEDLSTFFRAFRSEHGVSPGDWRESQRR